MFCTHCATEFEGNFCPNCGRAAAAPAPPELLADPPLTCCGSYQVLGGILEVGFDYISIRRRYLTRNFQQEIPLSRIIGVQFVNATFTENGFLHFIVPENRGQTIGNARQADRDPFSVVFNARSGALRLVAQDVAQVCEARASIQDYRQVRAEQTVRAEQLRRETAHAWHEVKRNVAPNRTAAQDRKKENQAQGVACCPKCGSASIQQDHLGLPYGKKVPLLCLNCGYKWTLKTK